MKKLIALMLAVSMMLGMTSALAGREAPADKKIIEDSESGLTTTFRKYDAKFWDAESEEPGTVEKLEYTTDVYGDTITNWLQVYLPYGYDAEKQYDVIYFFHGTNETPDSFISDARAKNCLDNMIETGVANPFIMVFPTYYYDYETRSNDKDLFAEELRKDIMPMIESKYSTYAPTPDTEGFIASRDHRAMCGYSQGSSATTTVMKHLLDTARWWMPMSGPRDARDMKEGILAQGEYDFFVYIGCGGKRDLAYDSVIPFLKGAAADDFWSFGTDMHQNNLYATISNEVHQTLIGRYYLYNMFCDGLLK